MTRYEAHITKDWKEHGIAHVVIARVSDDTVANVGVFLVDTYCLGIKDAFLETDVPASELEGFIADNFPAGGPERIHPTCAKKLIEGAIAYAEGLGFAPHRDFRKARRVLSGLDAALCPTEFTFGCEGRPCYIQGPNDDEARVDRVLATLEARFGPDGFDCELADEAEEDDTLDARDSLIAFFDDDEDFLGFFELSGMITAMLICPTALTPAKLLKEFWAPEGREWRDDEELQDFVRDLGLYWNYLADLVAECATATGEELDAGPIDIYAEDFDAPEEMGQAFVAWTRGFVRATEAWPAAWGDALTRSDLAAHWQLIRAWADPGHPDNLAIITAGGATDEAARRRKNLPLAITALARALRGGERDL